MGRQSQAHSKASDQFKIARRPGDDIALPPAPAPTRPTTPADLTAPSLKLAPAQLVRVFRKKFPQYRPELDDTSLYQHLEQQYPDDIKLLADPLLKGSELLLQPPPTYERPPMPTVPNQASVTDKVVAAGLRLVPPIGTAVGAAVGALPTAGGSLAAGAGMVGGAGAAGEAMAQEFERTIGVREEISPSTIATAGAFSAIPGMGLPAGLTHGARMTVRAAEGAGLSLMQQEVDRQLLGQDAPSWQDRAIGAGVGVVLGGAAGKFEASMIGKELANAARLLEQRQLTRNGLAGTIERIAKAGVDSGLDEMAARRYAAHAARALYQGRPVPDPPKPTATMTAAAGTEVVAPPPAAPSAEAQAFTAPPSVEGSSVAPVSAAPATAGAAAAPADAPLLRWIQQSLEADRRAPLAEGRAARAEAEGIRADLLRTGLVGGRRPSRAQIVQEIQTFLETGQGTPLVAAAQRLARQWHAQVDPQTGKWKGVLKPTKVASGLTRYQVWDQEAPLFTVPWRTPGKSVQGLMQEVEAPTMTPPPTAADAVRTEPSLTRPADALDTAIAEGRGVEGRPSSLLPPEFAPVEPNVSKAAELGDVAVRARQAGQDPIAAVKRDLELTPPPPAMSKDYRLALARDPDVVAGARQMQQQAIAAGRPGKEGRTIAPPPGSKAARAEAAEISASPVRTSTERAATQEPHDVVRVPTTVAEQMASANYKRRVAEAAPPAQTTARGGDQVPASKLWNLWDQVEARAERLVLRGRMSDEQLQQIEAALDEIETRDLPRFAGRETISTSELAEMTDKIARVLGARHPLAPMAETGALTISPPPRRHTGDTVHVPEVLDAEPSMADRIAKGEMVIDWDDVSENGLVRVYNASGRGFHSYRDAKSLWFIEDAARMRRVMQEADRLRKADPTLSMPEAMQQGKARYGATTDPDAIRARVAQARSQASTHPLNPRGETGAVKIPTKPVIDFDVPAGDVPALKAWMQSRKPAFQREGWYKSAARALGQNNPRRAWQLIQAQRMAQLPRAERQKLLAFAKARGDKETVRLWTADRRGERLHIATPPDIKPKQQGRLWMRASSVVTPRELPDPASIMTISPEIQQRILKRVDRSRLAKIKGNEDTDYRIFRQVADELVRDDVSFRTVTKALGMTPEQLAAAWTQQASEAARFLQRLKVLSDQVPEALIDLEARTGIPAAQIAARQGDSTISLYGGLFGIDPSEAIEYAAKAGKALDDLHTEWILSDKANKKGVIREAVDLRRATLTGTLAAAWRNVWGGAFRWNAAIVEDLMGTILSATSAERSHLFNRAKDRITANTIQDLKIKPFGASVFEMWPQLAGDLSHLPARDARHFLRVLATMPEQERVFLGGTMRDVPQAAQASNVLVKYLQTWNRMQEYPLRAISADLVMRSEIRRRGFDPNAVLAGNQDLAVVFGSAPAAERAVQKAVYAALDMTFASEGVKGSMAKNFTDLINNHTPLVLLQPFARFNYIAAPRYLWDRSPAALMEFLTFWKGKGRLAHGVASRKIGDEMLPVRESRLNTISIQKGGLLQQKIALSRDRAVLSRRIRQLEKAIEKTPDPVRATKLQEAQRSIREVNGALGGIQTSLGRLKSEETILREQVKHLQMQYGESVKAAAPESPGELLGRAAFGTAAFAAAIAIKSSQNQEDLPWYKMRVGAVGSDGETVLDLRAFGPFVQWFFFADLIADAYRHFDKATFYKARGEGQSPLESFRTAYTGKYTEGRLAKDTAQAVLSMSPTAGATATVFDLMQPEQWTTEKFWDTAYEFAGEFAAGFFQFGTEARNIASMFNEDEATVRIAGRPTEEQPYGPLAAPLAKFPGVNRYIPETYLQTTGEKMRSEKPWTRPAIGLTLSRVPNRVERELSKAGVEASRIYVPRLEDTGLNQQLAQTHARSLDQAFRDLVDGNDLWTPLKSPEERRDYLSRVVLPYAKALTWAEMQDFGSERIQDLKTSPARKEQQQRWMQLIERWSQDPQSLAPAPAGMSLEPPPGPEAAEGPIQRSIRMFGGEPLQLQPPPR